MIAYHVRPKNDKYFTVTDMVPFDDRIHHPGKAFVRSDNIELAESLEKEMKIGNEILILRSRIEKKWLKEPLSRDSIKIVKVDELEAAKRSARSELNHMFSGSYERLGGLNLFRFIGSMLKLMDAGYFITEKNREEKYLEIIQSEDDELIDALKEFLDIRDNIVEYQLQHYQHYRDGLKAIKKAKSEKALNEAMKVYRHSLEQDV